MSDENTQTKETPMTTKKHDLDPLTLRFLADEQDLLGRWLERTREDATAATPERRYYLATRANDCRRECTRLRALATRIERRGTR